MKAIVVACAALLLLTLAACPQKSAKQPETVSPQIYNGMADNRTAAGPEEFVGEPEVKPLAQSPLNLSGVSLGVEPITHASRYLEIKVELEQEWREDGYTGIQWRSFTEDGVATEENSYYNEGRLVGFQRSQPASEQDFDGKLAVLAEKYGEPLEGPPAFLEKSVAYEDFTEGEPDRVVFWADEPTNTVIAGRWDSDAGSAMWMLFNPQQLVSARADVMAAMGS